MITLAESKAQLNIASDDTSHDTELSSYIDAVIAVVERQTGQVVDERSVVEQHEGRGRRVLLLHSIPVIEVESVQSVDGSRTWDVAELELNPATGRLVSTGPVFDGLLEVTVQAGHEQVPPNYTVAALIILQHLWRTQRGPSTAAFGASGSIPEGGMGFAIPRRASELLGSMTPGVA